MNCELESLNKILENYEWDTIGAWNANDIEIPFQINSADFLNFAKNDLLIDDLHHQVNAFSNTKRAIECQIDSLLIRFGLFKKSKNDKWRFPQKMDMLNEIGIVSPEILRKINRHRNLLEHEYSIPNRENVEDAIDVASLFSKYTEKFLFNALTDFELYNNQKEWCWVIFDYKNGKFTFKENKWNNQIICEIDQKNDEYIAYLKWFTSILEKREKTKPPSDD
jgi:hypothetical protein